LSIDSNEVKIGETTKLQYSVTTTNQTELQVYLGYRVHYVRKNKDDAFKDFFLKKTTLKTRQTFTGGFSVKWKQLSTRKL